MIAIFSLALTLVLNPDPVQELVDRLLREAAERHHVPGGVVAIVRGDSTMLAGIGFARLEDSVRADPHRSIYRLASVAKLFVATVVLETVHRGMLALDDDVATHTPDVPIPATFPGAITIRHLLTHTAGLDERVIGYAAPSRETMRPLGEYLAHRLPDRGWPPGALVAYSNHGMALAAYAAERRAGEPFHRLAARSLFEPLGMTRTSYVTPADSVVGDRAPGYRCGPTGCSRVAEAWSHAYPVGLAFSTAADMALFMRAELQGGLLTGRRVLSAGTIEEAQRQQFTHDPRLPGMGLAFFEQYHRGIRLVTHAGGVPGAATVLALAPAHRLGVFVATNAGEPGFPRDVLQGLLDALLPDSSRNDPVATGPVDDYAGSYRLARYSHHTIERFPGVFAFALTVRTSGDTLLLPFGSSPRRFVRVDSLLLREVGGDATVVFRRAADGGITHLFAGLPHAGAELPAAFERVAWYEGAWFLNEYISWLLLLPLVVLCVWGLIALGGWILARGRRVAPPAVGRPPRGPVLPVLTVIAVQVLLLVFGFGFVARSTRELGRTEGIAFGMTASDVALLRLAWPIALAAVPIVIFCGLAWRRGWWSGLGRVCYTVLALGSVALAHFLVWFRYVPGRW